MSSFLKPNRTPRRQGFVLVIALWVMAFVLLLLLSMGSILRIESQSANTGRAKLEAKMNARLAAYKALGEIQRYTGPDQRVTARSDVLVPPGDPNKELVTGQGRWTGVWSSRENELDIEDATDGLNNHAVVWLVSGDQPDAFIDQEDEFIELATVNKSVSNKETFNIDDTVRVATEEILGTNDVTVGRYAYWVSDEGIKARVNLSDPFIESSDPNASYYRATMAQVADPTAVSNAEGVQILTATDSRWKQTNLDPSSITSLKNIPMFLEPNLEGIDLKDVNQEFFHDFTVHSSGVLANTKNGGLKRDLSTALLNLPEDLKEEELIFEPYGPVPTPGDPGGPKWEQLKDYFNLSQSASSVSGDTVAFRMPTSEQVGIAPVVTRWNFIFHPFAAYRFGVLDASGNPLDEWLQSSYQYSLGVFPLITLWNPYDYDLVLPRIGLECEFHNDAVIRIGNRNTSTNTCTLDRIAKYQGGTVNRWVLRFVTEATTIPAGRAINFTPPLNSYYSKNDPTKNVLKAGSHGELVNGFFSAPVVGSGSKIFYNLNNRSQAPWIIKQFPSVTTLSLIDSTGKDKGLFNQVVNLYDLNDTEEFSLDGTNRFKSLTFRGIPSYINQLNITTTRLNKAFLGENVDLNAAPQNFNDAIAAEGASVDSPYNTVPQISLTDLEQWKLGNNLCGISAYLKFPLVDYDEDRELPTHLTYNQNFTTPIYSPSINTKYNYNNDRYELYTRGPIYNVFNGSNWRNYLSGTDQKFSRVGFSNDFNGNEAAVFYNVPTKPILGIGQLMQANLINISSVSNGLVFNSLDLAKWDTNRQQAYAVPLYAIGNSIRNFDLPLDKTKDIQTRSVNGNSAIGANYDYCYELNAALWDRFFFSGYNSENSQLPNSRLRFWQDSPDLSILEDEQSAASYLLNEGAFNVNSTSVAAWESILGAMREVDVLGTATTQNDEQKHNFSRFAEPLKDSTDSLPLSIASAVTEEQKDSLLLGYRSLTDLQIKELAASIVEEIKTRASAKRSNEKIYPFLSMAEFINRSLNHEDNEYKLRGILQAAIDKTSINGVVDTDSANNTGLWAAGDLNFVPNLAENDLVPEKRPMSSGLSAFFMQADLLNKIGTMLQTRSDTFTIRSYGSAENVSTGESINRAYYEMTVQRLPEYLDSTVESYEEPNSRLNQLFGRKYKILSERWLDANNI